MNPDRFVEMTGSDRFASVSRTEQNHKCIRAKFSGNLSEPVISQNLSGCTVYTVPFGERGLRPPLCKSPVVRDFCSRPCRRFPTHDGDETRNRNISAAGVREANHSMHRAWRRLRALPVPARSRARQLTNRSTEARVNTTGGNDPCVICHRYKERTLGATETYLACETEDWVCPDCAFGIDPELARLAYEPEIERSTPSSWPQRVRAGVRQAMAAVRRPFLTCLPQRLKENEPPF